MSSIDDISLKSILKITGTMFQPSDIIDFCKNEEVILKLFDTYEKDHNNWNKLSEILIENEDYIDKEKLVYVIYLTYKDNLKVIDKTIKNLEEDYIKNKREIDFYKEQEKAQKKLMNKTKEFGKRNEVDAYILRKREGYSNEVLDSIISSKEEFSNKKFPEDNQIKRFDELMEKFKMDDKDGNYLLAPLVLTDMSAIFPDYNVGLELRNAVLERALIAQGSYKLSDIEKIRDNDSEQYGKILESADREYYIPEFEKVLYKNIRFVNIDKLLLMCAARMESYIDANTFTEKEYYELIDYFNSILDRIDNKEEILNTDVEDISSEKERAIQIKYSYKDIQKLLNRFIDGKYIKKSEVEEKQRELLNGDITIEEMDTSLLNTFDFTEEEIKQLMTKSEENLVYAIYKLNLKSENIMNILKENPKLVSKDLVEFLSEEEIIDSNFIINLYKNNLINNDDIKELLEKCDLSDEINIEKISNLYEKYKNKKEENKELDKELKSTIELFKLINADKIENENNKVAIELAENFEDTKDMLFYYEHGLLSIENLIEWTGDSVVKGLYEDNRISLDKIKELTDKHSISDEYIKEIYNNLIWKDELSEEDRIKLAEDGYISLDTIEQLYRKRLINEKDLKVLEEKSILSSEEKQRIVDSLSLEEAEENSKIILVISDRIKKIHTDILDEEEPRFKREKNTSDTSSKVKGRIIHPEIRHNLLESLGAKSTEVVINEDSPFYNYEFYIIPDQNGKINLNSPVIAERYYEEKENPISFARDNATYFFRYGDLMVLSNYLKKDEVVDKKENVVFRSSHTLANDKHNGHWAMSVISNIVKTTLGSDLKDYNKEQAALIILEKMKHLYNIEELQKIFKLQSQIDETTKHVYEVISFNGKARKETEER